MKIKYLNGGLKISDNWKLHFDEHATERQKSGDNGDNGRFQIPGNFQILNIDIYPNLPFFVRNWSRHDVDAAWNIGLSLDVASQQRSNKVQRQDYEGTDAENRELQAVDLSETYPKQLTIEVNGIALDVW